MVIKMKKYTISIVATILILLLNFPILCAAEEVAAETEAPQADQAVQTDQTDGLCELINAVSAGDQETVDRLSAELETYGVLTREEITAVIRQVQTSLGEKYGETQWYQKVSAFVDRYIGYIVSAVLILSCLIVLLIVNKKGIAWGKGKVNWLREKFVPWINEKSNRADQLIDAAAKWQEQAKEAAEQLRKQEEQLRKQEEQARQERKLVESDKQALQKQVITLENERIAEAGKLKQKDQYLTKAMMLMASELSFIADTFGLNNKAAEMTKAKYTAMMDLLTRGMEEDAT